MVGEPMKEFDALPVVLDAFGYRDEARMSILGEGPCYLLYLKCQAHLVSGICLECC